MSSNIRTTFVAEELVRAAKASDLALSNPTSRIPGRNVDFKTVIERNSEQTDSGICMLGTHPNSLQSEGGILSGEDVEKDAMWPVAKETTLFLRQPKAEHEEHRKVLRTHLKTPPSSFKSSSCSVKRTAPARTQFQNPHASYKSMTDEQSKEAPCFLTEEQRVIHYLLPNKDGDTGLHLAVILRDSNALDKMLQVIAKYPTLKNSVDDQNNLYQTPLHLALHTYQYEMVRKLVINGASLSAMDHKGNTPLHIACGLDSTKCLDEILGFTSMSKVLEATSIPNNEGQTCVHVAASHGCKDILRKLRRIGTNMNAQDLHNGKTALHFAAEKQHLSDTYFLVESCGLDVNARTFTGCTPLHIAAGHGCIETVAYLLSAGADPELQTDEGDTALNLSVSDDVTVLLTKVATLKWLY